MLPQAAPQLLEAMISGTREVQERLRPPPRPGKAKGEAEAIQTMLEARENALTDEVRARITLTRLDRPAATQTMIDTNFGMGRTSARVRAARPAAWGLASPARSSAPWLSAAATGFALARRSWSTLAWAAGGTLVATFWFFRDPERRAGFGAEQRPDARATLP